MKKPILFTSGLLSFCLTAVAQDAPTQVGQPGLYPAPLVRSSAAKQNALGLSSYSGSVSSVRSSSTQVPPIVLRFSGAEDEANPAIEEDLKVMSRLLERSLEHGLADDASDTKMGIRLLYSENARSVRAMYVEGFGAVFMIKVGFPVFAPTPPEPKEPQPPADTEWEKVKRDINGEAEERGAETDFIAAGTKFDSEQVEELKKDLLQTLKNAANIRNLKPNDYVAVTVFGHPSTVLQTRKSKLRGASNNSNTPIATTPRSNKPTPPRAVGTPASEAAAADLAVETVKAQVGNKTGSVSSQSELLPSTAGGGRREEAVWVRQSELLRSSSQGTVLTIRVKKADVDAFAKGKLDLDSFQKVAQEHSYYGSGYGITSINSWSKPTTSSSVMPR